MYLRTTLPFVVLFGACWALNFDSYYPETSECGVRYKSILKQPDWRCDESQYQTYPKTMVDSLLKTSSDLYYNETDYLSVVKGCQKYHDNSNIYGENEYYTYESLCHMKRKAIRVIWATVPNYPVPANLARLNQGLLPVHVLEGQNLFDVECTHPWANGVPSHIPQRMRRRLQRIRFTGLKRNLCLAGYAYNYNLMCKRTGFMSREVLVYSQHANQIFSVVVPDVPTACACAMCSCNKNKNPLGLPAIV